MSYDVPRRLPVRGDRCGSRGVYIGTRRGGLPSVLKRAQARAEGKAPRGPAGYQEGGCAPLSYYDRHGARLCTRRMARMPEPHKATLQQPLTAEVMGALIQRPALRVVKGAEGAPDNGSSLREPLPFGGEGCDFYHAPEHLGAALGAAYGDGTRPYQARGETLRPVLRDDPQGVDKGIGALARWRPRSPRRQAIHQALAYFRAHRHRMC